MTNSLSFELDRTAAWRKRKAEKHPSDTRNQTAISLLQQLSQQTADAKLERLYDTLHEDEDVGIEKLGEAHSEVLGDIGFRWEPKHIDEVLTSVIEAAGKNVN